MTVREIIIDYCKKHFLEADGLCCPDIDCGCSFDDMCLYGNDFKGCQIAKYNKENYMYEPIKEQ